MTEMPSAYQGTVLSARSRRLRTIGLLLLAVVVGMAVYGMSALMPPINHAAARLAQEESQSRGAPTAASSGQATAHTATHLATLRRNLKVQVAVAYAYWGVCALLLISVLFIAWLDLREISRNYVDQRRAIWSEAVERANAEALSRGPAPEE